MNMKDVEMNVFPPWKNCDTNIHMFPMYWISSNSWRVIAVCQIFSHLPLVVSIHADSSFFFYFAQVLKYLFLRFLSPAKHNGSEWNLVGGAHIVLKESSATYLSRNNDPITLNNPQTFLSKVCLVFVFVVLFFYCNYFLLKNKSQKRNTGNLKMYSSAERNTTNAWFHAIRGKWDKQHFKTS